MNGKTLRAEKFKSEKVQTKMICKGYAVVRPVEDNVHEIVIRVWDGFPNSAIILPRNDQPLPHHGRQKEEILEQMRLISGKELDAYNVYNVWLERLRKAE